MTWWRLAWRGWSRRPLRAGVTAAGVGIAVAACFSLLTFQAGYRRSLAQEVERLGAHILVVPKGCPYDAASLALHGANWPCYLRASYLREVRETPGVAAAAPVLMTAFHEAAGIQTVYLGVDTNILALKPRWRITGRFPVASGDLMIGGEVARHRGWTVGQRVVLPGLKQVEREVSGFLDITQGPDDRFLFLPLEDAQFLFNHTNELTHILVRLNDPNQMDNVVGALRGCNAGMQMNIVPLAHLFQTIQSMVNSTRWFLGCVTLVGLLAAATGVSASLLIAVAERTCEIGVLRALGASRPDIFRLFWMESVQTCLVGGSVGVLAGRLVMGGVEGWLRGQLPFVPDSRLMTWEWGIVGGCLGLALILGTLSAWLPAWRAANLAPMAAIRSKGGSW